MEKSFLKILCFFFLTLSATAQPAIQWQYSLDGTLVDYVDFGNSINNNMSPTSDGGFIIASTSFSNDGDVTGHHGLPSTSDIWVVKLDSLGYIEWQQSYGGSENEVGKSASQTSDGGYIICGQSNSIDGDVTGNHGNADAWILKLDALSNIEWQKSLGGSGYDHAIHVEETSDGGYFVLGDGLSTDGDFTNPVGGFDFWFVKLDVNGNIVWDKSLGGSGGERSRMARQTADGGFIAIGTTTSNDGDVTSNPFPGFLSVIWVVKTDSIGNIQWNKCYGGSGIDNGNEIWPTNDGGYILCSATTSNAGDITGNNGSFDFWVAKIDMNGNIEWSDCYGGSMSEFGKTIRQTPDSGFIIAGTSNSSDGDVSTNIGGF